jgi:hypothetical protein
VNYYLAIGTLYVCWALWDLLRDEEYKSEMRRTLSGLPEPVAAFIFVAVLAAMMAAWPVCVLSSAIFKEDE